MTTSRPNFDLSNLAVHALWALWFTAFLMFWEPSWRGFVLVALGLAVNFWGYAVLHNHMHVSIARPAVAHWIVSRTLGFSVGFAYRGFYLHHFNHHKHSNGPLDWGRFVQGESVVLYALRSTINAWLPFGPLMRHLFSAVKTRRDRVELVLDLILVQGFVVALIVLQPALGLTYFALLFVGQASIFYINYAAHDHSDASDRARLAVTSTSRFYNVVFFNAGYHQAHHLKPQAPWRELPRLTDELRAQGMVTADLTTGLSLSGVTYAMRVGSCSPRVTQKSSSPIPSAAT